MPLTIVTEGPEATTQVGEALGALARPGDVLLLQGPLGTGKTCLTQGLARGLGVTVPVTSPTFILVNQYAGRLTLYHVDLYRIEAVAEAMDLGLDDYFFGEGVCAVEWPERAPAAMPPEHLLVTLEHAGEQERRLTLQAAGSRYHDLARDLRGSLATKDGIRVLANTPPHPSQRARS
ncbi:MAG: tRNA (adenosine(37)-N6)-threonylcarbamoyltransferase complex ATPase subunit type 1 TsaE [Chloroflexi bacterium]|nr:tRNA (adenosine(37)-N6)-threonylcarbamoyltransferase complex ATPase subunit type 1 TsaE [Chloroflexota bacterium]